MQPLLHDDDKGVNVITDVATTVPTADSTALSGIHTRLKRRRLLPATHLVDGGYTSVTLFDTAARTHRISTVGPLPPSPAWRRQARGFTREEFAIDFDRHTVTCPKGKISGNWLELPAMPPTPSSASTLHTAAPVPSALPASAAKRHAP
ncbi:hypothetical protein AB0L71_27570 [Streptomyces sp. NPDC052052]|uniref:hypothetical protein n=1 Tax=Streptomyces sp. NPDC052052 TaxID=3154756 RepID=UPI0034330456